MFNLYKPLQWDMEGKHSYPELEKFNGKLLNIELLDKKKGDKIIIENEGMPIRKNEKNCGFGNLIIELA